MHWKDSSPREAISFEQPTQFRVCILCVPEADPMPFALAEFWRRVLTEGIENCSDQWQVLLFQMNLLGCGFTCVFTDLDLGQDEPPVFKLSASALEAECYALPERTPGDPREVLEYQALESRCLDQLREAVREEPAAGLLRSLRNRREFAVMACDYYRSKRWLLDL